jgi:NhaP-type Na+/H+ or K+/H+ antiporter
VIVVLSILVQGLTIGKLVKATAVDTSDAGKN